MHRLTSRIATMIAAAALLLGAGARAGAQAVSAAGTTLSQRHSDGRIWRFTGTVCSGASCPGWQMLDNNPMTATTASGAGRIYQMHNNGRIWRWTGVPCSGASCPGWQMIDNNPASVAIAATVIVIVSLWPLHEIERRFIDRHRSASRE